MKKNKALLITSASISLAANFVFVYSYQFLYFIMGFDNSIKNQARIIMYRMLSFIPYVFCLTAFGLALVHFVLAFNNSRFFSVMTLVFNASTIIPELVCFYILYVAGAWHVAYFLLIVLFLRICTIIANSLEVALNRIKRVELALVIDKLTENFNEGKQQSDNEELNIVPDEL